jgi:DNA-directed RNA polymerase specialized sigma24 family protein
LSLESIPFWKAELAATGGTMLDQGQARLLLISFHADPGTCVKWIASQVCAWEKGFPDFAGAPSPEETTALARIAAEIPQGACSAEEARAWLKFAVNEAIAWRLIGLACGGSERAFEVLTAVFSGKIRGIVAARITDPLNRDEAISRIWEKIWRRLPHLRAARGYFTNYLGRTARNEALTQVSAVRRLHIPSTTQTRSLLSSRGLDDLLWLNFLGSRHPDDAIVYAYRVWLGYGVSEILDLRSLTLRDLIQKLVVEYSFRCGRDQAGASWAVCAAGAVLGPAGGLFLGSCGVAGPAAVSRCVKRASARLREAYVGAEEAVLRASFSSGTPLHERISFGFLRFLCVASGPFARGCGASELRELALRFFAQYGESSLVPDKRVRAAVKGFREKAGKCGLVLASFQSPFGLARDVAEWRGRVQRHVTANYAGPQAIVWDVRAL